VMAAQLAKLALLVLWLTILGMIVWALL